MDQTASAGLHIVRNPSILPPVACSVDGLRTHCERFKGLAAVLPCSESRLSSNWDAPTANARDVDLNYAYFQSR